LVLKFELALSYDIGEQLLVNFYFIGTRLARLFAVLEEGQQTRPLWPQHFAPEKSLNRCQISLKDLLLVCELLLVTSFFDQ
jgi:hypothetical protein